MLDTTRWGAYGLQGGQYRERQGGDLDGAPDDVGHDKHQHAQLYQSARSLVVQETYVLTCHLRRLYGGRRS